jgi:hypothetical protein
MAVPLRVARDEPRCRWWAVFPQRKNPRTPLSWAGDVSEGVAGAAL